jgi:hypothetical protein
MTAPLVSRTVPSRVAVVVWALAALRNREIASEQITALFIFQESTGG